MLMATWCIPHVLTLPSSEQRNSEARRALYIQLHMVLLAWNLERAARIPSNQHPTPQFWQEVLVSPAPCTVTSNEQERVWCSVENMLAR